MFHRRSSSLHQGKGLAAMTLKFVVAYNHVRSDLVRRANELDCSRLLSITKVTDGSGIRTSGLFLLADA